MPANDYLSEEERTYYGMTQTEKNAYLTGEWAVSGALTRKSVEQGTAVPEGVNVTASPRTCTAEREGYIAHLTQCHSLGYMDDDEFAARETAAHAATTKVALRVMAADLPALPDPEQDKKDAEGAAAHEKAKATLRYRLKHNDTFFFFFCAAVIVLGVLMAVMPSVITATLGLDQAVQVGIGIPTIIGGIAVIVVGIASIVVRVEES